MRTTSVSTFPRLAMASPRTVGFWTTAERSATPAIGGAWFLGALARRLGRQPRAFTFLGVRIVTCSGPHPATSRPSDRRGIPVVRRGFRRIRALSRRRRHASNYTYAEATLSQSLAEFVGSTIRGFEFFGATPEIIVPDQLRSAVSGPDRYEPDINATYLGMAQHYQVAVSGRLTAWGYNSEDTATKKRAF